MASDSDHSAEDDSNQAIPTEDFHVEFLERKSVPSTPITAGAPPVAALPKRKAVQETPGVIEATKSLGIAIRSYATYPFTVTWAGTRRRCQDAWDRINNSKHQYARYALIVAVIAIGICIGMSLVTGDHTLSQIGHTSSSQHPATQPMPLVLYQSDVSLHPLDKEVSDCLLELKQAYLALENGKNDLAGARLPWYRRLSRPDEVGHSSERIATSQALWSTIRRLEDARKAIEILGRNYNATIDLLQHEQRRLQSEGRLHMHELGLDSYYLHSRQGVLDTTFPAIDKGQKNLGLWLKGSDWIMRIFLWSRHGKVVAAEQAIKSAACSRINKTILAAQEQTISFVNDTTAATSHIDNIMEILAEAVRGIASTTSGLAGASEWTLKLDSRTSENLYATGKVVKDRLMSSQSYVIKVQSRIRLELRVVKCREEYVRASSLSRDGPVFDGAINECDHLLKEGVPEHISMLMVLQNASITWGC